MQNGEIMINKIRTAEDSDKFRINKIRTAEDSDKFRMALVGPDQAFFASETKWGVGRLERLVSPATLAAYQRGWSVYREALEQGDHEAVAAVGPRMVQALAYMDAEATAAGHQPLAPETWEAAMPDGTVLVVVRTSAEATAVIRGEKAANGYTAHPSFGMTVETRGEEMGRTGGGNEREKTGRREGENQGETTLPPDLAVTVRQQHEGRTLHVITVAEVARLVAAHGSVIGTKWEGSPAHTGRQMEEGAAADLVRSGYPLEKPVAVGLDF